MKYLSSTVLILLLVLQNPVSVKSQNTYDQVFQIVQTHCAGSSCHDGSTPTFNINVSSDSFYHEILNKTPVNPAAAGAYNKILIPGDVQRSFLLRKISNGISDGLALNQPSEGLYMPSNLPPLANNEIELVRQWIMNGAPETGNVVDTAVINTYYRTGGQDDTYSPHAVPAAGTGFQIYLGRIFINAGSADTEFFYKFDPHITQAIQSNKIDFMMPAAAHHFSLFIFQPGADVLFPPGLRPYSQNSMENVEYGIPVFAGLSPVDLPTNTAFFFDQGIQFDLDLHVENPHVNQIFSCDAYVNVYTQPVNSSTDFMRVGGYLRTDLAIPNDNQPHTLDLVVQDSSATNYWKIWKLYSHTHKYGTAYNMWALEPDGVTQGEEIYNGNYSYEQGFDVGYYRWGPHVTVHTWPGDSLYAVNPWSGILGKATWINTGADTVRWGFSAADEMDVIFFMYIYGDAIPQVLGINSPAEGLVTADVFPNPVSDEFALKYTMSQAGKAQIQLLDLLGNKVANLVDETHTSGQHTKTFNASDYKLPPGIYLVSFNLGGKTETRKLIITS